MSDELAKGLKERLLAAGLAVAMPKTAQAPEMPKPNIQHVQQAPKSVTEKPKIEMEQAFDASKMKFDPSTLNQEMYPIAHIESSFGRNMKHHAHSGGEMNTALGGVGLKPQTAFELYQHSKSLQKLFPNFQDPKKFLHEMRSSPQFYNAMADGVWRSLGRKFQNDKVKMAYGWNHGANKIATDDEIKKDPYVKQYLHYASGKMEKPSAKMSQAPKTVTLKNEMDEMIEALKKHEKENKLKIAQAAFKTTDGKVCPCGPIHDPSCLPEGSVIDEEGFVLKDGTFVNRAEATKLLHTDHPVQSQEIDMEKAMPSPNLPKLGVENRRETPIVSPEQAKVKNRING